MVKTKMALDSHKQMNLPRPFFWPWTEKIKLEPGMVFNFCFRVFQAQVYSQFYHWHFCGNTGQSVWPRVDSTKFVQGIVIENPLHKN